MCSETSSLLSGFFILYVSGVGPQFTSDREADLQKKNHAVRAMGMQQAYAYEANQAILTNNGK